MLNPSKTPPPEDEQHPLTHVEEQEILRRETIAAFHGAVDSQVEDDFLIPREKTQDEREREEEEYRVFLEREVGDLREVVSVDGFGNDEDSVKEEAIVNEDREFLMKYVYKQHFSLQKVLIDHPFQLYPKSWLD